MDGARRIVTTMSPSSMRGKKSAPAPAIRTPAPTKPTVDNTISSALYLSAQGNARLYHCVTRSM
jgi:hypothetical protein